ncbi:hypothetical protein [Pseudoalteromonas nigrifaciens]|uniref:hypothetical protein n=1 Tax=Pseudoalteromonas nigrifaciens TaxID=28109 RepID=UPI003F9DDBA3
MQRIYSSLLIIAMLLTLVGQAVASVTMLCEMPHMSQTQHAATNVATEKVHQQMSVSMMNMDCCDDAATEQECNCPINACSAYSMLSVDGLFSTPLIISEKIQLYSSQNQHHLVSSLYRPPMSA